MGFMLKFYKWKIYKEIQWQTSRVWIRNQISPLNDLLHPTHHRLSALQGPQSWDPIKKSCWPLEFHDPPRILKHTSASTQNYFFANIPFKHRTTASKITHRPHPTPSVYIQSRKAFLPNVSNWKTTLRPSFFKSPYLTLGIRGSRKHVRRRVCCLTSLGFGQGLWLAKGRNPSPASERGYWTLRRELRNAQHGAQHGASAQQVFAVVFFFFFKVKFT